MRQRLREMFRMVCATFSMAESVKGECSMGLKGRPHCGKNIVLSESGPPDPKPPVFGPRN